MARVTKSPRFEKPFLPIPPTVSPEQGIKLLRRQREKGVQLLAKTISENRLTFLDEDYDRWEFVTCNHLIKAFGSHSPNVKSVVDVEVYGDDPAWVISQQLRIIDSLIEVLEMEVELQSGPSQDAIQKAKEGPLMGDKKIFIVHGQNHAVRDAIDLFITKELKLQTVVMEAGPWQGRSISEKFEQMAANCSCAVFILTADDDLTIHESTGDRRIRRARQNVILEVGYFWGTLGRHEHVVFLVAKSIDLPSDLQGIGSIEITSDLGETKRRLEQELRAADLL